jgi:hypothetical protein
MNAPSPEVDVFISNYTIVDPDVYHLWVNGYSGKHCLLDTYYNIMFYV